MTVEPDTQKVTQCTLISVRTVAHTRVAVMIMMLNFPQF